MELQINSELRDLIPKLQEGERDLLEKSLIEEGVRDKLIVWEDTIIDGHNRYELCLKNDIEFETQEMEFDNMAEAKNWMIDNQLARRNLTDSQRRYFIGKRYEEEKKVVSNEKGSNQHKEVSAHSEHQPKTSEKIAKDNNTSQATVRRNANYSRAIDTIRGENKDVGDRILSEDIRLNNKEVMEINAAEPEEREKVYDEISKGVPYKKVKKPHVSNNSGNNEWYTPVKFIEIARTVMGSIDTDPASSELANKNVQADTYYTEETNGLEQEWQGNVWMNPPYAQPLIQQFSDKLVEEIDKGNTKQAMVLVNNATETKWFNTLSEKASAIWFPKSRIKFIDVDGNESGAPLQGQAILYFGDNIELFKENCSGLVCECSYD